MQQVIVLTARGKYRCPHRIMRAFKAGRVKLKIVGQYRLVSKGDLNSGTVVKIQYGKFSERSIQVIL